MPAKYSKKIQIVSNHTFLFYFKEFSDRIGNTSHRNGFSFDCWRMKNYNRRRISPWHNTHYLVTRVWPKTLCRGKKGNWNGGKEEIDNGVTIGPGTVRNCVHDFCAWIKMAIEHNRLAHVTNFYEGYCFSNRIISSDLYFPEGYCFSVRELDVQQNRSPWQKRKCLFISISIFLNDRRKRNGDSS